jgi:predicted alpha/beta-hydrolase family hydrolase
VSTLPAAVTGYRADDADALLVLAHGAGAGQHHPFMVAAARGLAARRIDVVTFDFPYMAQGRSAPDRAPVLEGAFRTVVDQAIPWSSAKALFIGGKSMGGRMATHLAAQGTDGLRGVVVFGYPLHPPGKPDQLRVAHLPEIGVPVLIVQGERDAFGTPDELGPYLKTIPGGARLHAVERADHSLSVRGARGPAVRDEILDVVAAWLGNVLA